MAKVAIVFHAAGGVSDDERRPMPVATLNNDRSTVLTSSATSAVTALSAASRDLGTDGGFVSITPRGNAVWVTAGSAPVAAVPAENATGAGFPVLDGQTLTLAIQTGHKVAVIDWTL